MMKTIKVNPVRYQMLQELAKKKRVNIENFIGELIENAYSQKR